MRWFLAFFGVTVENDAVVWGSEIGDYPTHR